MSFCPEPSTFRCSNGQCIPISYRCDGDLDCNDGTDEQTCGMLFRVLHTLLTLLPCITVLKLYNQVNLLFKHIFLQNVLSSLRYTLHHAKHIGHYVKY